MNALIPDTTRTIVRTERMLMVPMAEEHRESFVHMHDVSAEHFAPWSPRQPEGRTNNDLFDEQLERSVRWEAEGRMCRRVGILADGSMTGVFTVDQVFRGPFLNGIAGWRVNVEHINKGIATEGMRALLDLCFGSLPLGLSLHRIEANVIPENVASLRVADKLGFRQEGLSPCYLRIDGQWRDHARFAKLIDNHVSTYLLERM